MNDKELKNEEQGQKNSGAMAIIFIVIGVVLIVVNVSDFSFENWWVLFMLIPVAMFAHNIYNDYRANGRIINQSTGIIIASIAILATMATFLFEAITWGAIWPIGLIFAGIAIFFGNRS